MCADARAQAALRAAEAGIVAALQAMILALVARILSRLEAMVVLWQAGQLPNPSPVAACPRARQASSPRTRSSRMPSGTGRSRAPGAVPVPAAPQLRARATPRPLRSPVIHPRPCPPNRPVLSNGPNRQEPTHAYFVTIS